MKQHIECVEINIRKPLRERKTLGLRLTQQEKDNARKLGMNSIEAEFLARATREIGRQRKRACL